MIEGTYILRSIGFNFQDYFDKSFINNYHKTIFICFSFQVWEWMWWFKIPKSKTETPSTVTSKCIVVLIPITWEEQLSIRLGHYTFDNFFRMSKSVRHFEKNFSSKWNCFILKCSRQHKINPMVRAQSNFWSVQNSHNSESK